MEPDGIPITLANILTAVINEEEVTPSGGILHHEEDIDIMPGNIELSALEVVMGNVMSRELILKDYIDMMRERYDYILIDCMPSLGMMTINALVAADSVLIPVQAAYLPVKGLQQLIKTILMVKKRLNRGLEIQGSFLLWWITGPIMQKISRRSCVKPMDHGLQYLKLQSPCR